MGRWIYEYSLLRPLPVIGQRELPALGKSAKKVCFKEAQFFSIKEARCINYFLENIPYSLVKGQQMKKLLSDEPEPVFTLVTDMKEGQFSELKVWCTL